MEMLCITDTSGIQKSQPAAKAPIMIATLMER